MAKGASDSNSTSTSSKEPRIVIDEEISKQPATIDVDYRKVVTHLRSEVDPGRATVLLVAFSFMTGIIDSVSFTAIFVWCGFQTGNFVQLSLALARLFAGPLGHRDLTFHRADQQALVSLITFNMGSSLGRIGDRIGPLTRLWLVLGTFLQAMFTAIAAIAIWKSGQPSVAVSRGDPAWTNLLSFVCVAFMSASLGLQGIMGKRLNTPFGTTLVLTTIWCELIAEPQLFKRHWVSSRDHRVFGAVSIFVGGFFGRALVDVIGTAGTLGVGAGIRMVIALGWLFVPGKRSFAKS